MKRIATLLAATVLGSGCIVTNDHCDSTITVDWPSFLTVNGATASCSIAGVSQVDVYLNGNFVATWNCSDGGATITQVQAGNYLVTVEGIDAGGNIVLRDEKNVGVSSCGDYGPYHYQPAEGLVQLGYTFSPSNVCYSASSYIWFSVYDQIAGAVVARIDQNNTDAQKRTYLCGEPISFALPQGSYTLQWVEEWNRTGTNQFAITGADCTDRPFTVAGAATTPVTTTLVDANAACP